MWAPSFIVLRLGSLVPLALLAAWQGLPAAGQTSATKPGVPAGASDKKLLFPHGSVDVWTRVGNPAFFFESGMAIDANGAPRAYHPNNRSGLDDLRKAGAPGGWRSLALDSAGKPVVQSASDPAPGYYVSTTSLFERARPASDPRRYVDSTQIPYIALPPEVARRTGVKLGDMAAVINRRFGKQSYAIYADAGTSGKLGEGSIALANSLRIRSEPRYGGMASGVVYVVFPNSGNGRPRSTAEIYSVAAGRFEAWGGTRKVNEYFSTTQPILPAGEPKGMPRK